MGSSAAWPPRPSASHRSALRPARRGLTRPRPKAWLAGLPLPSSSLRFQINYPRAARACRWLPLREPHALRYVRVVGITCWFDVPFIMDLVGEEALRFELVCLALATQPCSSCNARQSNLTADCAAPTVCAGLARCLVWIASGPCPGGKVVSHTPKPSNCSLRRRSSYVQRCAANAAGRRIFKAFLARHSRATTHMTEQRLLEPAALAFGLRPRCKACCWQSAMERACFCACQAHPSQHGCSSAPAQHPCDSRCSCTRAASKAGSGPLGRQSCFTPTPRARLLAFVLCT